MASSSESESKQMEEFTFDITNGDWETYDWETYEEIYEDFIEFLRRKLGVRFSHDRPVLAPLRRTPTSWFEIVLKTDSHNIRLRMRRDSLYLDGYQTDNSGQWLEFGSDGTSPSHLITGSSFLGFDGGYVALERAAGRSRNDILLGRQQLTDAVNNLATSTNHQDRAESLIIVIQMISESIRFGLISAHLGYTFIERRYLEASDQPQAAPSWMQILENAWGDLSAALLRADADRENRFHLPEPNFMGITGPKGMDNVAALIGMLLDPCFTGNELERVPQGRPLVEVFSVHIEDIYGGSVGDLYGTITVIDGLGAQCIYDRERDNSESINPGNAVLLTGPARSISAYGSFTIEVALMDKDRLSRDYEISRGQILWNVFNTANKYDMPLCEEVKGTYGRATVNYMVLSDAAQATIEVTLIDGDHEDTLIDGDHEDLVNVYGLLTACSAGFHETVLFRKTEDEYVRPRQRPRRHLRQRIPLLRSVVAVPFNSSLIVSAVLYVHDRASLHDEIAKGTAEFPPQLSGIIEYNISGNYGKIRVMVTWDICHR